MRVLNVAYPFAPVSTDAVGGSEQVLAAIDRALVVAGHDSLVIARAESRVAGRLLPVPPAPGTIDAEVRARVHEFVRRAVAKAAAQVDLVHLHGIDFAAYLPPPGPPVLITLHMPPSWYPPEALAPERAYTWLNCVSEAQAATLPPFAAPRLLPPIANGAPIADLAPLRRLRRGYALMLGRICPEKGQHLALAAAHASDVPLVVAGEAFPYPEHLAYLEHEVRSLLDGRRRLIGAVGFARKRRLLTGATCLLVPSQAPETSSLVAMEALAAGTPVIAWRSGALPGIVRHGVTGWIVESVKEMAEAIRHAGEIAPETCREEAVRRFALSHTTDAYLALYHRLCSAR